MRLNSNDIGVGTYKGSLFKSFTRMIISCSLLLVSLACVALVWAHIWLICIPSAMASKAPVFTIPLSTPRP